MRWLAFGMSAVVAACGASGNQSTRAADPADAGSDAGEGLMPFALPVADGGDAIDSGMLGAIHGECAGVSPKPLTAGAWTEPLTGITLHWPTPWVPADPSSGIVADAPYTYVPAGVTAATPAQANMTISPSTVSSDADGQGELHSWVMWAQEHGGSASQITLGGYPAVIWWDQEAPPQPGCATGCGSDPGPDYVWIGLAAYLRNSPDAGGLTVVELHGSARINAQPVEIFCDMEAMALGVTFAH